MQMPNNCEEVERKCLNCLLVSPYDGQSYRLDSDAFLPCGLAIISAVLKNMPGLNVTVLNLASIHDTESHEAMIMALLEEKSIDVVLSGGNYHHRFSLLEIFRLAKQWKRDVVTIAGGVIITGDPEAGMSFLEHVDYGVVEEGEITIQELIEALRSGASPEDCKSIDGLIFRIPGKEVDPEIHATRPRAPITDWKKIPLLPDYESFGIKELPADVSFLYHLCTGRGCPNACTFCRNSGAGGSKYRERPLEDIIAEIEHSMNNLRPFPKRMSFFFADDVFSVSKPRFKTICAALKRLEIRNWVGYLRVSFIDEEVVGILKDTGCRMVFLGVESGTDKILRSMRKGITVTQNEKAFELLSKGGIRCNAYLILGDPEETYEDAMKTIDFYYRWRNHPEYPTLLRMTMLGLMPGSLVYKQAVSSGKIRDTVGFLRAGFPIVNVSKMSDVEFKKVQTLANMIRDNWFANDNFQVGFHSTSAPRLNITYDFSDKVAIFHLLRCKCGNSSVLRIPFDRMLRNTPCSCPMCKTVIHLFNPKAAAGDDKILAGNINALLGIYGKVAFWGIGLVFHNFITRKLISILREGEVYLVDKTGASSHVGKPVFPPDVIADEKIPCVINCTYPLNPAHASINNELKSNYPGVAHIEHLYALQDCNFRVNGATV